MIRKASKTVLDHDGEPRCKCIVCGKRIYPGDLYDRRPVRFGGTVVACQDCRLRPSHLTSSEKLFRVYSAKEELQATIGDFRLACDQDVEPVREQVAVTVDVAREVAEEYRSAGDAMNGAGSRYYDWADCLDEWADTLEAADPDCFEFDPTVGESREDQEAHWREEVADALDEAADVFDGFDSC